MSPMFILINEGDNTDICDAFWIREPPFSSHVGLSAFSKKKNVNESKESFSTRVSTGKCHTTGHLELDHVNYISLQSWILTQHSYYDLLHSDCIQHNMRGSAPLTVRLASLPRPALTRT